MAKNQIEEFVSENNFDWRKAERMAEEILPNSDGVFFAYGISVTFVGDDERMYDRLATLVNIEEALEFYNKLIKENNVQKYHKYRDIELSSIYYLPKEQDYEYEVIRVDHFPNYIPGIENFDEVVKELKEKYEFISDIEDRGRETELDGTSYNTYICWLKFPYKSRMNVGYFEFSTLDEFREKLIEQEYVSKYTANEVLANRNIEWETYSEFIYIRDDNEEELLKTAFDILINNKMEEKKNG